ncbi:hypothetical protein GCM10007916_02060 [Psychromonas marina]|uniref:ABC-type transport auxiliary lipoprotein component domain-containing protein n=1 Tax=Psychromonas marina TaxID=88364 RepID=A0ABQ6DVT4_9GAMM|nr:YajG family lipoprotein [Psychromonas marina]GLS89139.1 hypothetical protein GCM10007916_02060 [Psychromonas marina]
MKNISLTLPSLLLSILFLSACSTTPSSLQLTPKLDENISVTKIKSDKKWSLTSQDLRTERYLIAISSGDDVATLINESTSTRTLIEQTLKTHWLKQGHQISNKGVNGYQIDIQLLKLLAEVEQNTMNHETDINLVIKVQLKSETTTFSKTFRSHYEEKAPFSASVTDLAQQLNKQLSQLLDQIVQDPEVNDKLAQL